MGEKEKVNYLFLGMDACRWDAFELANTPNIDSIGKARMVHSSAGWTGPSMLHLLTNSPFYGDYRTRFLYDLTPMTWVPTKMTELGYFCAFVTPNQVIKKYNIFRQDWSHTDFYWNKFRYSIDKDVEKLCALWQRDQPKLILLLSMETHRPYPYSPDLPDEYFKEEQPFEAQIKAVEALDTQYRRIFDVIDKDTLVTVFSDHGTLFKEKEGRIGHGFWEFHHKLFEVPFVRGKI